MCVCVCVCVLYVHMEFSIAKPSISEVLLHVEYTGFEFETNCYIKRLSVVSLMLMVSNL